MKRKQPGIVRALALLLALVLIVGIFPISAFASEITPEDTTSENAEDYGISLLATSAAKTKMLESDIFKALLYLGYDSNSYLRNNDLVFETGYYGSKLLTNYPDALTDVPYSSSGTGTGLQTVKKAGTATGLAPDLATFKSTGLDCVDFAAYYLVNYLPNIAGKDVSVLTNLMNSKYKAQGYTFDHMEFWPAARSDMAAAGVKIYKVDSVDYNNGEITKYTGPNGKVYTTDIYTNLNIGALIQMGNKDDATIHYGIYAGTYNGNHYIIHSGNVKRGPEVSIVEYMSPEYSSSDKASVPLYFYDFSDTFEQYGSLTIKKVDSNGTVLSGATFYVRNSNTGEDYKITTGSNGLATLEDLPLGTYTITETEAPSGYVKSDKVLTVTLTADKPDGGGTFTFTNTRAKGSIQVAKYNEDATKLITGAVFCCVDHSNHNSRIYIYDADSGAVTFTDPHNQQTVTAYADGKADGLVTFTDLPTGTYQIFEPYPPTGYVRDSTIVTVVLTTNGQTEYIKKPADGNYTSAYLDANGAKYHLYKNTRAKGSIQVGKYNEDATALLTGAVFCCVDNADHTSRVYLYDADSGSVTFTDPNTGTTVTAAADGKADGLITFSNLPTGEYCVFEAYPPEGYIRDSTIVVVNLTTDGQIEYIKKPGDGNYTSAYLNAAGSKYHLFTNKEDVGSIKIIKDITPDTAETPENLAGWQFNLFANLPYQNLNLSSSSNGSQYRVKITDKYGNVAYSDAASIAYSPITEQPQDLFLAVGSTGTFVVEATGSGLSYQWQYSDDGTTWVNIPVLTNRLTITMDAAFHGRQCRCVITDADGNAYYSDAATLYYDTDLVITEQPKSVICKIGKTATFGVKANGTNLSYKWYISPDGGNTWYFRADGSSFTTYAMAASTDAYLIRCEITDGTNTITSDEVVWTRPDHTDGDGNYLGIVIAQQPESVVDALDSDVQLAIQAAGEGLVYEWEVYDAAADTWLLCNAPLYDSPYTTGEDGTVQIDKIPSGSYFIKEVDTGKSGWTYDLTPKAVEVTVNNTTTAPIEVTFYNKLKWGSLLIKKETNTGTDKGGWKVNVYKDSISEETLLEGSPFETDENGEILIEDLPIGTYIAVEVDEGKDLWICDVEAKETTVTFQGVAEITINNTHLGRGQIIKETTNGGTKAGWIFEVRNEAGDLVGTYTTGDSGIITFDLLPGAYTVTEIGPIDDYWTLDDEPQTVEIVAGETSSATFTNQWHGQGQIIKETTNGGTKAGWIFEVRNEAGDLVGTYTTDDSGIITFDLQPGVYTVAEIGPIRDYWVLDTEPQTIGVIAGETSSVTFLNQWSGKGQGYKKMADGSSAAGWEFEIVRASDNTSVGTYITDQNGIFTTDLLEPGEYLVYEKIPEGSLYQCEGNNPMSLNVVAGETVTLGITNILRPGKISIEKVNYQGEKLAGAKFLLEWSEDGTTWTAVTYNSGSNVILGGCTSENLEDGCLVTGEDGLVEFTGLHPGLVYRLTEIEAPAGYMLLSDSAFTGTLPVEDLTVTLTVHNNGTFDMPASGSTGVDHGISIAIFAVVVSALMILGFAVVKPIITDIPNKPNR